MISLTREQVAFRSVDYFSLFTALINLRLFMRSEINFNKISEIKSVEKVKKKTREEDLRFSLR
jgi:hypothetical protein